VRKFLVPGLGRSVGVAIAALAIGTQIVVLVAGSIAVVFRDDVRDWLTVGKSVPTATIDGYVSDAGMSAAGRFYLYVAHPTLHTAETFDESCPIREKGIAVLGCYDPNTDTIHLLDITDDTVTTLEPVVAAHEMLHAVWARFDDGERDAVGALVNAAFDALPEGSLTERLTPYRTAPPRTRVNELFAILGTEVAKLPNELEAIYERYFDRRNSVVELADRATAVFASITSEIADTVAAIQSSEAVLAKRLAKYTKLRTKLDEDVAAFNAQADTPGAFPSSSEFSAARAALTERSRILTKMRDKYNELVSVHNDLIARLSVLNAQALALNEALGIDAAEYAPVEVSPAA
jgi:hypothetical protein